MSTPTLFIQIWDEKRTIVVDWLHENIILEIWKLEREKAGESIDNPPPIQPPTSAINFNSLKNARYYKNVQYWVIERALEDFDTWPVKK
jgi:hypothetical protein